MVFLKSITTKIGSGATPRGGRSSYKKSGISLIRSQNVYDFDFNENELAFINISQGKKLDNVTVEPNDILLNITGASVARCCVVPLNILPARVNQHVAIIRVDKKKANPLFVHYSLASPFYKEQLLSLAQKGGTREAITKTDIEDFEINLPNIGIQNKMVNLLTYFDFLIQNIIKRMSILEEICKNIYEVWFIFFRYNGYKNDTQIITEMGEIPVGWEYKTASESLEIDPYHKISKKGEKKFIPMSSIPLNSMIIEGYELRKGTSGSKFQNKDTLFARITPSLENGKTAFVQILDKDEVGIGSTEFIVLRSNSLTPEFVYLMSRNERFRTHAIISMVGASGRQRVQKECFDNFYFPHPPRKVLEKFSSIVKPMFDSIHNLSCQKKILRDMRNLLLPKLISSEIDLSEVEIDGLSDFV